VAHRDIAIDPLREMSDAALLALAASANEDGRSSAEVGVLAAQVGLLREQLDAVAGRLTRDEAKRHNADS